MIVVVGASGFIGRHLVADLRRRGEAVRPVVRPGSEAGEGAVSARLDQLQEWPAVLDGADAVVHLAAHNPSQRSRRAVADAEAFRRVNVEGTAHLAGYAASAGVPRFVFMSSIRVYGKASRTPATEDMPCLPDDHYGRSKHDAEQALKAVLSDTATDWTILRPPVVYGPGRGGVIGLLDRLVRNGIPVPLAGAEARRSLVYVGNLLSAIGASVRDGRAARQTFNVSDGPGLSYEELARLIAGIHGARARLAHLPSAVVGLAERLPGTGPAISRLLSPCLCDDTLIRESLGWSPPYATADGLRLSLAGEVSAKSV